MRGDGRVLQRGKWLWISYCYNGEEQREAAKDKDGKNTADPKVAARFLKIRTNEIDAENGGGQPFLTPRARRITILDLGDALKADFTIRGKASPQNLCNLAKVSAAFGDCRAVALTSERVDKYIEERQAAGDRPATINRVTQLLKQSYRLAILQKRLNRNSEPYIRHLPEKGNERQGFLTETELAAVVSRLPQDLRDFMRWSSLCGMRKGETASLTWDMVNGDELHVPGDVCKNRKPRVLPLSGELAKIIERRRAAARVEVDGVVRMVPFIFHRDGEAVGRFNKAWATACVAAGVGVMRCPKCEATGAARTCPTCEVETRYHGKIFHDLRRVAVRRMVRAGVAPQVAKKWSGHTSDSMFDRYAILTTDDMRDALEQTEKFREAEQQKQGQGRVRG
jgi:integrase